MASQASETTLKKLQVVLTGNTKQLQSAMETAQSATDKATGQIEKGLNKVDAAFKKVAKAAAAYISVKALVDFGKSCVELGSDLTEVQNVVDVTFGSLSGKIDDFAKGAIKSFGLSETAAKKYSSTMGAMLKSMGLSVDTAYDMSTTLTGLAGDLASFYNLSSDEAFAKLRSGISGETEPLKQLGINMSVANLEAYALSKGIDKAFDSMTQAEQATLRYNYLLETTKDAQGDFARTSGSWSNQVKILSMQFDSLKASLGQGRIMALTPVIKVINQIVAKLAELAERFKILMATITGNDLTSDVSDASVALAEAEGSAEGVGDKMTDSMGKAEKAVKRFLMGFDEIHKLQGEDESLVDTDALSALSDSSTLGNINGLNDATASENEELSKMEKVLENIKQKMQPVIERGKELAGVFKDGFFSGLGSDAGDRIKGIVEDVKSIGDQLKGIFTDSEVLNSANTYADKVAEALGKITGSVASIGITIAENLVGGIESFLSDNSERIKGFISEMFTIKGDVAEMWGNFAQSVARIFSAFGGQNGKRLTGNIIGIFSNAFMSVTLLAEKLWRDIVNVFTKPITMNTEGIRQALDDVLGFAADVTDTIEQMVQFIGDKANAVYDEHTKPMFDSIAEGLGQLVAKVLEVWDSKIKPMLDEWGAAFQELWEAHMKPMFDKLGDALGALFDALKVLWENILQPLISFIITDIIGNMLPVLNDLFQTTIAVIGDIFDALSGLFDIIKGVLDFVVGVFTGDWERAWDGVCEVFQGFGEVGKAVIDAVLDLIGGLLDGVIDFFAGLGSAIASGISNIIEWGKGILGIESDARPADWTLDQAVASGRTWDGSAYQAMQQTSGMSRDDMYGAMSDALADNDTERDIYLDGEQIGTILDSSRRTRNTRLNPSLSY